MVNIIGKRVDIQPVGAAAPDNGLGQVMAGLGKALFADTLTPALKREQMQKIADENEVRSAVVGATGADGNINNARLGSIGAMLGVIDPSKLGRMQAMEATRSGGVDSTRAAQILTGMGEYRNTPLYGQRDFENKLDMQALQEATKLRIDDNKLVQVQGTEGPIYARQGLAPGMSPVLSTDQVKAGEQQRLLPSITPQRRENFAFGTPDTGELGVATTATGTVPVFVRSDGIFNAQDGRKIEEPVTSFGKLAATSTDGLKPNSGDQSTLLNRRVAARSATAQIDNLDKLLSQPNADAAVGFIGRSATVFNDIRSQVEAANKLVSPGGMAAEYSAPGIKDAVDGAMSRLQADPQFAAKAQALGVQSTVLRSQIVDLAYTIAKAKDPSGRMSNQDVERATEILGGALMDPAAGRQVLGTVKQQILESQNIFEQEYERMYPGKGAQPNGAAPAAPQQGVSGPRQMQTRSGATVVIERVN